MFWTKPNEICPFPKWKTSQRATKTGPAVRLLLIRFEQKNCVSSGFALKASCVQKEAYIRKQKCHNTRYNVRTFIRIFAA